MCLTGSKGSVGRACSATRAPVLLAGGTSGSLAERETFGEQILGQ